MRPTCSTTPARFARSATPHKNLDRTSQNLEHTRNPTTSRTPRTLSTSENLSNIDVCPTIRRRRRQKYIERQIALDKGTVNVRFHGQAPEGTGPPNRHGMPQLPVGQHEVKNWPVLDLGEQPDVDSPRGSSKSAASSRIRSR